MLWHTVSPSDEESRSQESLIIAKVITIFTRLETNNKTIKLYQ